MSAVALKLPRISIVIPTLNRSAFLRRALESIVEQDDPNCEIIVIDGGSNDSTIEVIDAYSKYISAWISEPDNGQSDAIAKGFALASGEILAWLNSDDIYLAGAFAKFREALARDPNCDVFYGHEFLIDEADRVIGERRVARLSDFLIFLGFKFGGFGIYQPAAFWKADIFNMVGGIDDQLRFTMDTDLFIRFGLVRARFSYIDAHIVGFRIHPESKTSTIQHVAVSEFQQLRTRYNVVGNNLGSYIVRNFIKFCRLVSHFRRGEFRWLLGRALEKTYSRVP